MDIHRDLGGEWEIGVKHRNSESRQQRRQETADDAVRLLRYLTWLGADLEKAKREMCDEHQKKTATMSKRFATLPGSFRTSLYHQSAGML